MTFLHISMYVFDAQVLHVQVHESRSHMWNSGTMLDYLSFLSTQIKKKRIQLGLTPADGKALIICDKAAVHGCQAFERARCMWEHENDALLIHGSTADRIAVPGGFGALGAPNDGWHQFFHGLRRAWLKVAAGFGGSLRVRQSLARMSIAIDGNHRFSSFACIWRG